MEELKKQGNEAFSQNKFDEAVELYSKAIEIDTNNAVLYSNRSACYASLSKWDQALKDASACVTKDPNFIKGYNRLATAQIGLKKYEEAVASIKKGLSKDPDNEALKTQLKSLQLKRNGALEKLFGHQLLTKSGLLSTSEACKSKKRVAIYFSAHWCPPCKQFTPLLDEMYQDAKRIGEHELEVIFCSSDHDSASFRSYFQSMPWVAVPFEEERTRSSLSSFYSIQGIPALFVLDSFGNVIDANARNAVATSGGSAADCLRQWSR